MGQKIGSSKSIEVVQGDEHRLVCLHYLMSVKLIYITMSSTKKASKLLYQQLDILKISTNYHSFF